MENLYKSMLDNIHDGIYFVDLERNITYWNKAAEEITGYSNEEVLGKSCKDNILIHVDNKGVNLCISNCPLHFTIQDGKVREGEFFLHHKKGHRIPVFVRTAPIYDDQNKIIGALEMFYDNSNKNILEEKIKELEKLSFVDELTKVANRRYFDMQLNQCILEYERYNWPFGILFADVDHFKKFNDQYGHDMGDRVLRMVASTLMNNVRAFDIVARYGGEEFVILLKNVDFDQLYMIAEKLRFLVEKSVLFDGFNEINVTISIGGTLMKKGDNAETLLKRADTCLYNCKNNGRNRVTINYNES